MISPITNAITIDLEDWIQSVHDHNHPLTDLFVRNTHRVLDVLDVHDVRATFFVLGLAAGRAPQLIRDLVSRGHDVQSHGFAHQRVDRQTRDQFSQDLDISKKLLEDIAGRAVTTYRAPRFSIIRSNLWALDVLAENGFTIDSSIFPMQVRGYGISGTPFSPYRVATSAGEILEAPVMLLRLGPISIPAGGGGYFRLLPGRVIQAAVRRMNDRGLPATIYLHPYEFAPEEFNELPLRIPLRKRLHQGLGRGNIAQKVGRLLKEFRFGTIHEAVGTRESWPAFDPSRDDLEASLFSAAQRSQPGVVPGGCGKTGSGSV